MTIGSGALEMNGRLRRFQSKMNGRFRATLSVPDMATDAIITAAHEFPVILTPDEDGVGFVVECPIIPGCISQGDTRDEALANIREAIELCLENQAAEGWQLPAHVEITKVAV
jgi:predicted RNase H-like HicB family nuclease